MGEYRGVPTDQWLTPEDDAEIITQIQHSNPVEQVATKIPMRTKQRTKKRAARRNPRFLSGGGGQNEAYPREHKQGDIVALTAEKMGLISDYDEDDLSDLDADVIRANITETRIKSAKNRVRAMIATDVGKQGFAPDYALGKDSELGVGAPYESVLNVKLHGRSGMGTEDVSQREMILCPGNNVPAGFNYNDITKTSIHASDSTSTNLRAEAAGAYKFLTEVKQAVVGNRYGNFYERDKMVWIFDEGWEYILENSLDTNKQPMLTSISEGANVSGAGPRVLGAPSMFAKGMTVAATEWEEVEYYLIAGLGTAATNNVPPNRLGKEAALGDYAIQFANANLTPADTFGFFIRTSTGWSFTPAPAANADIAKNRYVAKAETGRTVGGENINGTGDMVAGGFFISTDKHNLYRFTDDKAGSSLYDRDSDLLLCIYANTDHLWIGPRMETQFMLSTTDAFSPYDSVAVKFRERQAFAVGRPEAMALGILRDA